RVTEELTARQPLDGPSHYLHRSNSRSEDHLKSDRPTWPMSRLDGEGDGPSAKRRAVACFVGLNPCVPDVMIGLTDYHRSDEPSIPLSLRPVVTSPFLDKGDREIDGPSGM
ncbi:hypothetical protein HAX54_002186, partial [Datura stramonium]|nr:hypothetical protein [Datura stramonium]